MPPVRPMRRWPPWLALVSAGTSIPMGGPLALVLFRQLYYTGVQSAGIVMLLAALAGAGFVLTLQASLPVGVSTVLELLATLMAKVLGVVFTLLVIAARSVSAISTELAMVQVTGE
ncbi:MAG: ABC transporter permease, partial [Cyanobacteria bacterium K_Offshore_0m_m2_072]|nr:ABC transporter permease [Cyanobacteria bacterium K_Offshore_0m_m2_072]